MDAEFRQVVDAFKAKAALTPEELQSFQFSSLSDVSVTMQAIQDKQAKRGKLRHLRRIEPFLKTMMEFGKVVEVFLNASDILAFVWGPLKFLLMTASSFVAAFDSLVGIYQQIGEQIPMLESYHDLFSTFPHMRTLLVQIYEDILSFHAIAIRYFRQKLWKQFFKSNWKGFTSEIDLLMSNMNRHKLLIESRASLIEFDHVQSTRASTEAILRETKASEARRQRAAVFEWLSSPNVDAVHERHVKSRSANAESCRWILDDDRFRRWFDPVYCSIPLLWINGKPGAGKSVLASMIIEEAKKLSQVSVAYFYCGFRNPERDGFLPLARAVLSQLLMQNDSLLLYFEEKMSKPGTHGILSSLGVAQEILQTALKSRKAFLILDGIDECGRDQRKEICTWFRYVVESLPTNEHGDIRCVFISQDDGIARKDLSMLPTITITPSLNKADITTFTRQWQTRIEERFGLLQDCGPSLVEIVPARSQGIFIFAKCVLEEMFHQPSREHLLREWSIQSFPSELEQVYDRILQRLMSVKQKKEVIEKLLSWVSLCKRPLRWFEIQAAISIDLDDDNINKENRRLVDTCKDLCASFVEQHSDTTVELVHSTVREFLTRRKIIIESQVDLELCHLSLAYLNFPDFSTRFGQPAVVASLLSGRYAFYEYAVACWPLHLMSWLEGGTHEQSSIDELQDTLEPFLQQHLVDGGSESHLTVSKAMHDKLRPVKFFEDYDALAQVIVWCRKQASIEKAGDANTTDVLDFPKVTHHIRSTLEDMARDGLTAQQKADLKLYYGPSGLFKCPKIFCHHFAFGFTSREHRDTHLKRHEPAYTCKIEGCHRAVFGYLSLKDLENHMLESHGVLVDNDEFPRVAKPTGTTVGDVTEKHVFQCSRCPKVFTRKFNLRSHERTHTGERPYACPVCGVTFSRAQEQRTHTRRQCSEKAFRCRGDMHTGTQWGCGRGFAEVADFARHLRSTRGRRCLIPLAAQQIKDDEAAEAERSLRYQQTRLWPSNPLLSLPRSSTTLPLTSSAATRARLGLGDGDPMDIDLAPADDLQTSPQPFPRALLAQYPALSGLDGENIVR